jgi:hypothetical protein
VNIALDISTVVSEEVDVRKKRIKRLCDKDIASIPSNPVGYQKKSKQTPVASKETVYTHFFSLAPPRKTCVLAAAAAAAAPKYKKNCKNQIKDCVIQSCPPPHQFFAR